MRHFAITVAYDGTPYGGWQIQQNTVTIQQVLIDAIEQATGERVHVQGSGRTDSGVHASGQVAAFTLTNWRAPAIRLVPAINRFLPRSIALHDCRETVASFDPIREAKSKRYRYTLRNARTPDPIQHPFHWWFPRPLDVDAMKQGGALLLGTHDFSAFETLGSPRKTSVRTVKELSIDTTVYTEGCDLRIEIEADGFLYNMMRNIVGALCEVGVGRFAPRWIQTVLESKTRNACSQTAPPQGLCLIAVRYPESLFVSN